MLLRPSLGLMHSTLGTVKAVGVLLAVEVCRSLVAAVLSFLSGGILMAGC